MSLPLLVAIVVIGISLTVAAVHFTGGSMTAHLDGADEARRIFALDFPDEKPSTVMITSDGQSAFLALPRGRTGIVQSFGDGFFTRIATPSDVAGLKLRAPATVSLRFRDFTWTGGHFSFADAAAASAVVQALDPAYDPSSRVN
ncbi:MAG: hypothetical protein F9K19_17215 [Rhizobiaceae bacterium]|nr:MAG: hypothetical protein F9K19_17215 [Rhizobiaceae bacterium]CAG0972576.1 hypothetical protein RHIZO_01300 [Rhizobiaceae bacterium]